MRSIFFLNSRYSLFLLLLISIFSRLATSIFYMEDIDSLRFALSVDYYDVLSNQPHFPGYPLFCFIFKLLYAISGSLGFSASIIGGFSMFFIIVFAQKIYYLITNSKSFILTLILFFNPFLWIMSNRYMPDLLGLSLLVMGLYFFLSILKNNNINNQIFLGLSIGLLLGVRISYLPFFIPLLYLFFCTKKSRYFIFSTIFFTLLWFFPWIFITNFSELLQVALNDTQGHFFRWGGTIYSEESSLLYRFIKILESIFADSFGMWWNNRHWLTLINSFFLIPFFLFTVCKIFINIKSIKKEHVIIIAVFLCYFIWVFLFQNIVYKPRHLMPFIPIVSIFITYGLTHYYYHLNTKLMRCLFMILFIPYILISLKLVHQHTNDSSISQISNYINKSDFNNIIIISDQLMNYYFHKTIDDQIVYLNSRAYHNKLQHYYDNNFKVFSTVRLNSSNYYLINQMTFYHNPYVNKLWSKLTLYEYEKQK